MLRTLIASIAKPEHILFFAKSHLKFDCSLVGCGFACCALFALLKDEGDYRLHRTERAINIILVGSNDMHRGLNKRNDLIEEIEASCTSWYCLDRISHLLQRLHCRIGHCLQLGGISSLGV